MKKLFFTALMLVLFAAAAAAAQEAPAALSAVPYNSKVLLTWAASVDSQVTAYNVYRSTRPDETTASFIMQETGLQQFDGSVVNLVNYFYWIKSVYNGEGQFSSYVTVTPYAAPYTPASAGVLSVDSMVVSFTWSASPERGSYDLSKYVISRGTEASSLIPITATAVTIDSYSDTVPSAGVLYYYGISLRDTQDHASGTRVFSVYVPDIPSKPSGLTGTGYAHKAGLRWDANPSYESISAYMVYRDANPVEIGVTAGNYYDDADVTEGETHVYTIKAQNSSGLSVDSEAVTVNVLCAPPQIEAISGPDSIPGQVLLRWAPNDAAEGVTGYNVFRSITPGGFDFSSPLDVTGTPYYYDIPPVPGQQYFYKISAYKTVSGPASAVEKALKSILLPVEVNPIVAEPFSGYVTLSWTDPGSRYGASGYHVFYAADPAANFTPLTATVHTYAQVTGLVNNTPYYFKVMTQNVYGESNTFNAYYIDVTPASSTVPEAVKYPSALSPGDGTIRISWTAAPASSGVTAYNVYRSTVSGSYTGVPVGVTLTTAIFTDATGTTGTQYFYVIKAVGTVEGPASAEVSEWPYIRPAAPKNVLLQNLGSEVLVAWDTADYLGSSQSAYCYRVYRAPDLATGFSQIASVCAVSHGYYTDSAINTYSAYYYKIKGYDDLGREDMADNYSVITAAAVLEPPAVLLAIPGDSRVTLIWRKVTPDYYNIYRRKEGESYGAPIKYYVAFGSKEFVDETVVNGQRYYYTIKAVNSGGEGPASNEAMAVPYIAVGLPEDKNIKAVVVNKKEISLAWNPASSPGSYGVGEYLVYRSIDGGGTYALQTGTAATTYTDTATVWDRSYYYLVKIVDVQGNTDAVYNPVKVELPLPENKLRIFRNMINLADADTGNDTAAIRYFITVKGSVKIRIHTLSGAFVRQLCEENITQELSVDNPLESGDFVWDGRNAAGDKVASGVYLIVLEAGNNRIVEKIAVVR
ncbi:MAG: hypothetical protein LLG37_08410 [Spirochaetia bacterium]|nr:hypothetical protein [Spirochaetia bacterium]